MATEFKLSYTANDINNRLGKIDSLAAKSELPTKTSELTNDSGFVTESYVQQYAQPTGDYALKSEIPVVPVTSVNGQIGAINLRAEDVGALPDTTEIPTVPTNVSAFTNDAGYLTEHQSLADYAKTADLGRLASKDTVSKSDLASDVQASLGKANTALQSYTETDPTVPSWAKASTKPTYTASEVGADASGTASSAVSAHNTNTSAHNDIRTLISNLTTRLNALADSDDTTLDQMSEVVAYIKSNKTLIEEITTNKVNVSDIINNLTTNVSNKPLSAAQGVALKSLIDSLQTEVDGKAETSALTSHTGNTTVHITSTERTNWNAAKTHADSTHAPSNAEKNQNAFSNVVVGSTKIAADTTTDSLTLVGSNVTLTPDATNDKVTIGITKDNVTAALGYTPPTTNTTYGVVSTSADGLAPKRDGSTTKFLRGDGTWAVPPDTNTTYSAAGSSLGLVKSGGDVTISSGVITVNDDSHNHTIANVDNLQTTLDTINTRLDYANMAYGTCSTAAATAAKVITVSGNTQWQLAAGSIIVIKFSATNTASNPTFNVNDTGAKPVWYGTSVITTGSLSYAGYKNRPMEFMYDGTQYVFIGWSYDANSTYSNVALGHGYVTCSTAAATTAKVGTLSSYALTKGGIVAVKFTYAVPANSTLNINSKGAKAMFYRGQAITADVIGAGDIATFIYDGTQYHLLSIDRWQDDITSLKSMISSQIESAIGAAMAASY